MRVARDVLDRVTVGAERVFRARPRESGLDGRLPRDIGIARLRQRSKHCSGAR